MIELWRKINGFPKYEVSSLGRVRRIDGDYLKLGKSQEGYPRCNLITKGGAYKSICVHRLVCEAFHGPKPSVKHEVAHLDGSKNNNTPGNLQWKTRKENIADSIKHGVNNRGQDVNHAKLTEKQVIEIKTRSAQGEPTFEIIKDFSFVHKSQIYRILSGYTWKHVGSPVKTAEK